MSRGEKKTPTQRFELSSGNRITRFFWGIVQATLFRCSPRPFHRWRNLLLRMFGAKLHPSARVYNRARVWLPANLIMQQGSCIADDVDVYCVATITIAEHATVSQYSFLCTASHDFDDVAHPLTIAPIVIDRRAWVAADVFIGPGVSVGAGAVVAARSSVFRDVPPWMLVGGSPAQVLRPRKVGPTDFGEALQEGATP
ncbi:MAG: putative colanic acid biosynthesis acetyltransferase [Phycisphaerales bacterium]